MKLSTSNVNSSCEGTRLGDAAALSSQGRWEYCDLKRMNEIIRHFTRTDRTLHSIVHLTAASYSPGLAVYDHSSGGCTEVSYGLQVSGLATSRVHITI